MARGKSQDPKDTGPSALGDALSRASSGGKGGSGGGSGSGSGGRSKGPSVESTEAPAEDNKRTSRRAQLASFEAARKRDARRRTLILVGVCVALAAIVLAYPVYIGVQDWQARSRVLADIGVAADAAGCDPAAENAATGNQEHVAVGTKVTYAQFPPDSGAHYDTPAPFTKRFYGTDDRPAVETLVHNLEHGYTLAWYRADGPPEVAEQLEAASKTFTSTDYDVTQKFIAAPWSEADGGPFPAGKNVVLARWVADPNNPGDASTQRGVRQACVSVSGPAISAFMAQYPAVNSPEPNGA